MAAGSVGTKQLKNGAVTTAKLKASAVTDAKIKTGAVTTAKVAANAITGEKVLESSLGKVPAATSADHATAADNATSADNATHATSADNATTFGGVSASVFGTALSCSGWDFHPQASTTTYSAGSSLLQRTSVGGSFAAPLHLPQGAKVTKLTFFYWDDGAAGTAGTLWFTRLNLAGASTAYGVNATDDALGARQVVLTFATAQVIDNSQYAYSFEWSPGVNGCRLAGARVEYTLP